MQKTVVKKMKRLKNLSQLINMMRQDRIQKDLFASNPHLAKQDDILTMLQLQGKKPDVKNMKNMPLGIRLEAIEKYGLDAQELLSRGETKLLKLQKDMHIPEQIKITNLRKLLHKSMTKANKWMKESLKAENRNDFEYYMVHDKSMIDKNSLLYQEVVEEQKQRELYSSKLESQKGGYLDPNMRAIDYS